MTGWRRARATDEQRGLDRDAALSFQQRWGMLGMLGALAVAAARRWRGQRR